MGLVLHQWEISPFCGKVRKVLRCKGLPFEVVNYNGLLARKAAGLSPVGKLPVLAYDGEMVQDSSVIADFLEKRHPQPPLFPMDRRDRARAHFWEDWADESLYWFEVYFRFNDEQALNRSVSLLCRGRPRYERFLFRWLGKRALRRSMHAQGIGRLDQGAVAARFKKHLSALATVLEDRRWLVGNDRSIADIAVAAQLDEMVRTSRFKDEILEFTAIRDWLERNGSGE